jgi:hypothetical protein
VKGSEKSNHERKIANMYPILTKNYIAQGSIGPQKAVKFGTASGTVTLVGVSDTGTIGVTRKQLSVVDGQRIDVQHEGIADMILGGTVARGALLGVDASGNLIAWAAGRGVGHALESGVAGDEIPVLLHLGAQL